MLRYYVRLAIKSLRRTPGLTALMICAIALGIATCIVTLTVYHAMSGNPIWWKSHVLYAVTMDSGPPGRRTSSLPIGPSQLTYRDATYLFQSDIPQRKAMMTELLGMVSGAPGQRIPRAVETRATTRGFFSMFDVPFEFGGPWDAAADGGPEPTIVLTHHENQRLFGGRDSVGRTLLWNGQRFRIVGVLDHWQPKPRFYDLTEGAFPTAVNRDDVYVPFRWAPTLQELPSGHSSCWGTSRMKTYQQFLTSNCTWIEMWVELPTAASRQRMQAFMDAYWAAQRRNGRFQRPMNNHLTDVGDWLRINHVVSNDSRLLLRLAFAFLSVCLINTIGILLAKFLRGAAIVGLRRALGASRRQVFLQHLVEVGLLACAGAALGLALGAAGLRAVQALYAASGGAYGALAHFDPIGIAWALALAALSTLAAGLYPAWSVGRLPPAQYLRSR